ncbi:MAG: prepilin peptidase [Candidatus Babeliales bacterium]
MFYFFMATVFPFGLCWGSFLNVVAHRLARQTSLCTLRSKCPHCNSVIAWYDNIPVLSYFILRGKCRLCRQSISPLYPIIELLTGGVFCGLFFRAMHQQDGFTSLLAHLGEFVDKDGAGDLVRFYSILQEHFYMGFFVSLLFFSALIVALRTDLEAMVIPQCASIWLVPFGAFFSWCGFTGISWQESMIGAMLGYGILWLIAFIFKKMANKDGMGVGDMELLAMIGAFIGPIGAWASLLAASCMGVLVGFAYLVIAHKGRFTRIPFGPFLVFGATFYFFFKDMVLAFLFC